MGSTDLFRKKKHSREKYEQYERLKKDAESRKNSYRYVGRLSGPGRQATYDPLFNQARIADKKLEKLYAQGHKEALALNKKYDALVSKLGKDAKEVYEFERDELGMRERNDSKKHIGNLVGIISIGGLIMASIISANITGNVIGGNSQVNVGSTIFLLIGLIFGAAWIFLRKK